MFVSVPQLCRSGYRRSQFFFCGIVHGLDLAFGGTARHRMAAAEAFGGFLLCEQVFDVFAIFVGNGGKIGYGGFVISQFRINPAQQTVAPVAGRQGFQFVCQREQAAVFLFAFGIRQPTKYVDFGELCLFVVHCLVYIR